MTITTPPLADGWRGLFYALVVLRTGVLYPTSTANPGKCRQIVANQTGA